jgi:hypothetical protein
MSAYDLPSSLGLDKLDRLTSHLGLVLPHLRPTASPRVEIAHDVPADASALKFALDVMADDGCPHHDE